MKLKFSEEFKKNYPSLYEIISSNEKYLEIIKDGVNNN